MFELYDLWLRSYSGILQTDAFGHKAISLIPGLNPVKDFDAIIRDASKIGKIGYFIAKKGFTLVGNFFTAVWENV